MYIYTASHILKQFIKGSDKFELGHRSAARSDGRKSASFGPSTNSLAFCFNQEFAVSISCVKAAAYGAEAMPDSSV